MKYRGYYIDGAQFTCKADIDALIKAQNIQRMQRYNARMMAATTSGDMMAASIEAGKVARFLHDYCGMSWAEIEAVEIA